MSLPVRWSVLGSANIAAKAFLPAMRAAGGVATVVGSRNPDRAGGWALTNNVGRAADYEGALASDDVDAIYIALPNDQHVEWAARAVATGRAVLCEKPLGLSALQTADLLDRVGDARLWESFVFPFHPQTSLVQRLCAEGGPIGQLREVVSEYHFNIGTGDNIRWRPERGGGSLMDVGCYPVRLAWLLFGSEMESAVAASVVADTGVDAEFASVATFSDERRLQFSVGMRRSMSTFTRIIGTTGEIRMSNPFHPGSGDDVQLGQGGELRERWPSGPVRAFQYAVEHIHAVATQQAQPQHLAATDSLSTARALDLLRATAAQGR
jgi:predicted dehydrogenase